MNLLQAFLFLPAIILLLTTGLYLSIKLRWLQVTKLPFALSLLFKKDKHNKFSSLTALLTVVGGNLGVGNISGTAIALKTGGPGFILWMMIVIVITAVIKYVTCNLSIQHRKFNVQSNEYVGGPVTYLNRAFGFKHISLVFLVIMIICAITVGNLVQVNSLSLPMKLLGINPLVVGIVMSVIFFLTTYLRLGGIAKLISSVVPIMTILYLLLSFIVLYRFSENIIPSVHLIFKSFLNFHSLSYGILGAFLLETLNSLQVGVFRGIFATDIGLGIEGIVHSSVKNLRNDPDFILKQSLITIISPFIVMVITFITTMVLLVTGVWQYDLESTNLCVMAFRATIDSDYVSYLIIIIMFCFSFTTIFTWFFCSKSTINCIFDNKNYIKIWDILFTLIIPIGSISMVQLLWNIADISISLMIIINTLAILLIIFKYKDTLILKPDFNNKS